MHLARIASLLPFSMEKKRWHAGSLYIFVAFVLASQIAPLMSPDYIWDDLVWYWSYRIDGTKTLFHFLNQVGHPLFWPFLDFPYRIFGEHATLPTTLISLAFHVANTILVWKLMCFLGAGRIPAFIAFVFYLLSPYYFNRGTVSHYFYDVFMFLWLFSVYLGAPRETSRIKRLVFAPLCQILSVGLPTLIMLEPFRFMVYWGLCRSDYRKLAKAVIPYWAVAGFCAIAAYFLFKPTGYYEGYNQLYFSVPPILWGISEYLLFLPRALYFHADNALLVLQQPLDWPFVILSALVVVAFFRMMPLPEKRIANRNTKSLLFICALSFFLGAAPYVLAARLPAPGEFNSRLFYVSGFACVVAISIVLAKIPSARTRVLFVSALAILLLASGFQQGKAYMYDYLVRQTVLSQLQSNMLNLGQGEAANQDMFIGLTAEPPFWELSVQHRLYDPMEFSVPLNIETHSSRGKWFVQYLDYRSFSPPDYVLPPHECTFAAHDRHPCPEHYILAEYRVNVNESGIANFSFVKLFFESFVTDRPMKIGGLVFLTEPRPMDINAMAVRWFRKLAEEGDAVAQNKVGLMYLNGFADISRNDVKALEWFQKSSAQGESDALLNVGLMYLQGRGVKKNDKVAAQFIYSAAKEGNATAQYNYGLLCEWGFGVTKSEDEAFTWYLKAAEQGYVLAQSRVGLMYADGMGALQDAASAVSWLRKAADKNDKNAQYSLALMLYEGRGVPRNLPAAIALLGKSADQGHGLAQFSLGTLYQRGEVVPKDDRESYFWYQLAARHSEAPQERRTANQAGQSLVRLLTEQDKKALDERVKNWRPLQPGQSAAWDN